MWAKFVREWLRHRVYVKHLNVVGRPLGTIVSWERLRRIGPYLGYLEGQDLRLSSDLATIQSLS